MITLYIGDWKVSTDCIFIGGDEDTKNKVSFIMEDIYNVSFSVNAEEFEALKQFKKVKSGAIHFAPDRVLPVSAA